MNTQLIGAKGMTRKHTSRYPRPTIDASKLSHADQRGVMRSMKPKILVCMSSDGTCWKYYYLSKHSGTFEIGPCSEFSPLEAARAAWRMKGFVV